MVRQWRFMRKRGNGAAGGPRWDLNPHPAPSSGERSIQLSYGGARDPEFQFMAAAWRWRAECSAADSATTASGTTYRIWTVPNSESGSPSHTK